MLPSIDLLIPTYNRSALLAECLESVMRAARPADLDWRVLVIDNNSTDKTKEVVETFIQSYGTRVQYVFEGLQGKSAALNRGIEAGSGDLVGMIDDDEQIDVNWFQVALETFSDPEVGYTGGPYLPLWRAVVPDWLPPGFPGVLAADSPESIPAAPVKFDGENLFPKGGNAIIRRSVLKQVGNYNVDLGRKGSDCGSCEDADMSDRLMRLGVVGIFDPRLIVYHVIPPQRVSRKYFRRWVVGNARSAAAVERLRPLNVKYVGRVPRFLIGSALRAIPAYFRAAHPAERFEAELQWWRIYGFLYGAYLDPNRQKAH